MHLFVLLELGEVLCDGDRFEENLGVVSPRPNLGSKFSDFPIFFGVFPQFCLAQEDKNFVNFCKLSPLKRDGLATPNLGDYRYFHQFIWHKMAQK
jgi:hypothetical protein